MEVGSPSGEIVAAPRAVRGTTFPKTSEETPVDGFRPIR